MKTNNIRKQFICLILSISFVATLCAVNMPDSIQGATPLEVPDTLARIDNSPMALNVIEGTPSGALSDVYIRAMSGSNATQAMQMGSFYTVDQLKAFFGSNWLSVIDYDDTSEPIGYKYNGYLVSMHPEYGFASVFLTTPEYAIIVQRDETLFLRVGMSYGNVEWPQDMHVNQPLPDSQHSGSYVIVGGGFEDEEPSCMLELHINESETIVEIRVLVWP